MFVLGCGALAGALLTARQMQTALRPPAMELPLFATGSDTGDSMSMATGRIDEEMEGLFLLDFLTGDLACAVLNSRTAAIGGIFKTNVIKDLGIEDGKKPSYLMVTGTALFVQRTGNNQPAGCVVYVCDQNTGNFAGYSLQWNRTLASSGRAQSGPLIRLIVSNAKAAKISE